MANSERKKASNSLGLRLTSVDQLVGQVNQGLPTNVLDHFIQFSGLAVDEVTEAVMIPSRTLSRRRKAGKFEPDESDRLMRLSLVMDKAVDLFDGDVKGARQWLRTPAPALGGHTPLSYAQTSAGAREVEYLIGRLEYGVYT